MLVDCNAGLSYISENMLSPLSFSFLDENVSFPLMCQVLLELFLKMQCIYLECINYFCIVYKLNVCFVHCALGQNICNVIQIILGAPI